MIVLSEKKEKEYDPVDTTKVRRGHKPRLGKRVHQDRRTNRLRTRSDRNRKALSEGS